MTLQKRVMYNILLDLSCPTIPKTPCQKSKRLKKCQTSILQHNASSLMPFQCSTNPYNKTYEQCSESQQKSRAVD